MVYNLDSMDPPKLDPPKIKLQKQNQTAFYEGRNLFNSTKLNFPLTALCSAILGVLFSLTYGGVRRGGVAVGGWTARRKCQ